MDVHEPASFFEDWRATHHLQKEQFYAGKASYLTGLLPEIALQFNVFETLEILHRKLGNEVLTLAFDPSKTIPSPLVNEATPNWMKRTNMVGVNVRTVGNFLNVVNYALTLPAEHDSVHLLPIWEPGVVGSLYGKVSFNINPEFFSYEWAAALPHLNTPEKQLKVTINLLHALGKSVGMDVIPHTDRFSEIVLAYPRYFEWVRRVGGRIMSHSEQLYREVEEIIWLFLHRHGAANQSPLSYSRNVFFSPEIPILSHEQRLEILFGKKEDADGRLNRRIALLYELVSQGLETLPMTMAPPYRGLHINPEKFVMDDLGNKWYEYAFNEPQGMSRVFGPLTRYKFFATWPDSWELNFDEPIIGAWEFLANQYAEMQQKYNFDFMRGDMAHVQPRPTGVPTEHIKFYDPLQYIKQHIQKQLVPYFAFFAETFLAEPDIMGYGNEAEHLTKIEAEATLGDLQSSVVDSLEFRSKFTRYKTLADNYPFRPCFTIITADKDDPRFDEYYQSGNHLRYFIGLFLTDWPSYYSLGLEQRNENFKRSANETYSKLYVFQIRDANEVDKYTTGPYQWGKNQKQFAQLLAIRQIASQIIPEIRANDTQWLQAPSEENDVLIWTQQQQPKYYFIANLSSSNILDNQQLTPHFDLENLELIYTSTTFTLQHECRIYKVK